MKINIFGSTGVIGKKTLSLIDNNFPDFKVCLLCAKSNLKLLTEQIKKYQPKYAFLYDHEKYSKIISQYLSNNRIDILINNTQGPKSGDVNSLSIKDYQKAFDLLFKNTVFTTMLAIEKMKKNSWGRIINMTSVSVKEPLSYLALSNSMRSSVISWAKTLSNDIGHNNVTVNNILTGYFDTERLKELNSDKAKKFNVDVSELYETMRNQVPLGRIGKPEEFGYLITFLASEYASYINGANIPIDGGLLKSI